MMYWGYVYSCVYYVMFVSFLVFSPPSIIRARRPMFTSQRNVFIVIFYLKIFQVVFESSRAGSIGVTIR